MWKVGLGTEKSPLASLPPPGFREQVSVSLLVETPNYRVHIKTMLHSIAVVLMDLPLIYITNKTICVFFYRAVACEEKYHSFPNARLTDENNNPENMTRQM